MGLSLPQRPLLVRVVRRLRVEGVGWGSGEKGPWVSGMGTIAGKGVFCSLCFGCIPVEMPSKYLEGQSSHEQSRLAL